MPLVKGTVRRPEQRWRVVARDPGMDRVLLRARAQGKQVGVAIGALVRLLQAIDIDGAEPIAHRRIDRDQPGARRASRPGLAAWTPVYRDRTRHHAPAPVCLFRKG